MKKFHMYAICFFLFTYYFYDQTKEYMSYQTVSNYHFYLNGLIDYEMKVLSCDNLTISKENILKNLRIDNETGQLLIKDNKTRITRLNAQNDLMITWLNETCACEFDILVTIDQNQALTKEFKPRYSKADRILHSSIRIFKIELLESPYDTDCKYYKNNMSSDVSQLTVMKNILMGHETLYDYESALSPNCEYLYHFVTSLFIVNMTFMTTDLDTIRIYFQHTQDMTIDTQPLISTMSYLYISASLIATVFGLSVFETYEALEDKINISQIYLTIRIPIPKITLEELTIKILRIAAISHCFYILILYFSYDHFSSTYIGPLINFKLPKFTICTPINELLKSDYIITGNTTFLELQQNINDYTSIYNISLTYQHFNYTYDRYYWNNRVCLEIRNLTDKVPKGTPFILQVTHMMNISSSILLANFYLDDFFSNDFLSSGMLHLLVSGKSLRTLVTHRKLLGPPYETYCLSSFSKAKCINNCLLSDSHITYRNMFIAEENFDRKYFTQLINNKCDDVCNIVSCEGSSWIIADVFDQIEKNVTFVKNPDIIIDVHLSPSFTISSLVCQLLSAVTFWLGINLICDMKIIILNKFNWRYFVHICFGALCIYHIYIQTLNYFEFETVTQNSFLMKKFDVPNFKLATLSNVTLAPSENYGIINDSIITLSMINDQNSYSLINSQYHEPIETSEFIYSDYYFLDVDIKKLNHVIEHLDSKWHKPVFSFNVSSDLTWYILISDTISLTDTFHKFQKKFKYLYYVSSKLSLLRPPYETGCVDSHAHDLGSCYDNKINTKNMTKTRFSKISISSYESIRVVNQTDYSFIYECINELTTYPPLCESQKHLIFSSPSKNREPLSEELSDHNIYFNTAVHCQFFPSLNFQTFLITIFGIIDFWFDVNLLYSMKLMTRCSETSIEKMKKFKIKRKIKSPEPVIDFDNESATDCDNIPEIPTYYVN